MTTLEILRLLRLESDKDNEIDSYTMVNIC